MRISQKVWRVRKSEPSQGSPHGEFKEGVGAHRGRERDVTVCRGHESSSPRTPPAVLWLSPEVQVLPRPVSLPQADAGSGWTRSDAKVSLFLETECLQGPQGCLPPPLPFHPPMSASLWPDRPSLLCLMLKTLLLCTVPNQILESVLGEVEKNSFNCFLSGSCFARRWGTQQVHAPQNCVSQL